MSTVTEPTEPFTEYEPETYVFAAAVDNDGLRVDVRVTVTGRNIGLDVYEAGEGAAVTAARLARAGRRQDGLGPFERPVPF